MELGFVEEVDDSDSDTPFVSKVGGKPAWTDLKTLPPEHTCKKCGKPTVLLVQFHAPHTSCVEDLGEEATEDPRTLFLFMCKDPHCHSPGDASPFHVLRYESGGSKFGSTYPHSASPGAARSHDMPSNSETGEVEKEEEEKDTHPSLCVVCGGRGTKSCGGCRKVNYCSRYHQIHDWKSGHQKSCSNPTQTPPTLTYDPSSGVVLPEWDVVTEPEPRGRGKGEERSEAERMRDYEAYVKENSVRGGGGAWSAEGLEELVGKRGGKGKEEDKVFKAFMKKVAIEKQQVLRYQKGGEPLPISAVRIPKDSDIPKCACGADRGFELQVMPQLLYYLKLDSTHSGPGIDWGTLLIYTCSSTHCRLGRGYHTEFLWKQEILTNV